MKERASIFVMENTILRQGKQCFRRNHYLAETRDGNYLPQDLYPFEAIVTNLAIAKLEKKGDWVKVFGSYDVMVWFRYCQGKLVGQSEIKKVKFLASIPLEQVDNSFLYGVNSRLCAQNLELKVVKVIVERQKEHPYSNCAKRLRVIVEQELLVFEYALNPLSRPVFSLLERNSKLLEEVSPNKETDATGPSQKVSRSEKNLIPTAPALLKGKVVNKRGDPLYRAKVKVYDGTNFYLTRTDQEGGYFLPLYPDTYELSVSKNGYIAQTFQLKLGSGEIKFLNFELAKEARRKGLRLIF